MSNRLWAFILLLALIISIGIYLALTYIGKICLAVPVAIVVFFIIAIVSEILSEEIIIKKG